MRTFKINSPLLIALSALLFIACSGQEEAQNFQPVNYLALGDSYTIGHGVEESERWPKQLSHKLQEDGYEVLNTDIIAKTGWKTSDLLNGIAAVEPAGYNLVSLLIGVNNQFWGQPFEIFTAEFDSVLVTATSIAGGNDRVFVLSIPDYGVTPFGNSKRDQIAQDIDNYNDHIRKTCLKYDIPFIDITGISRELGDKPGSLATDNLHPSGSQYGKWVDLMLPAVINILEL